MANKNHIEKIFELNPIKPGKISEISEATAASSVPQKERVNFHIGNPVQSEVLVKYYLRSILNLDIANPEDENFDVASLKDELDWDEKNSRRMELLYNIIKNSAPYSPRGGFLINNPIKLVQKFHQWLEKDQEEPLSYDLGEKSGRREILISSGGVDETLRILFHSLNLFLTNLPANIIFWEKDFPPFLKNFNSLSFKSFTESKTESYQLLLQYLKDNSDKPNYLIIGKIISEEIRRNLRELAFKYPLYFIEANDAPNHLSLAREAKLKNLVLRILTPEFISTRLKNSSVIFLAGNSDLLRIFESVHFQLKGTPSASDIELLQYLTDNDDEIKLSLQPDRQKFDDYNKLDKNSYSGKSLILENSDFLNRMSDTFEKRTEKVLSITEKFLHKHNFANISDFSSFDFLAGKSTNLILSEFFEQIDNETWYSETIESFLTAFAKEHPEYQTKNLMLINGSSRTALGLLGFHCGIEEVITCDYSWTYEHCFPKSVFIPVTDDFELDVNSICNTVDDKLKLYKNSFNKLAVVINNPHNASGKIFRKSDLKDLLTKVLKKNVYVIDDLAYQNVLPENSIDGPQTVKQLGLELVNEGKIYKDQLKKIISVHSLSKTDSFAGARIAVAEISDKELKQKFIEFNSLIKPNISAVIVAYLFYRNDTEKIKLFWLLRNRIFKAKMQAIEDATTELPESRNPFDIRIERPQGSMYPRMTINKLPKGLSLDWLSSVLATQGIGLVPLSSFARTSKGYDLGRKSFRLTLGGTDSPEVLLRKTRRVLIDLNRMIAEEQAKYNKHIFPARSYKRKNNFYLENSNQLWHRFLNEIETECKTIAYKQTKNFSEENEEKIISERFFEKFLPSRLDIFSNNFKANIEMSLDFLSFIDAEGSPVLQSRLESEFYKENLEHRRTAFKKRTFDRTVHPTQVFAIDTDILFNSANEKILKNEKPDSKLIQKISECLINEYLGKNVAINSAKEGEELVCDLKAMISAENFSSLYSENHTQELLSFWGDWDGSNRPSGQGHRLVAAALIENVNQLSNIIKTIISIERNVSIEPKLLSEITLLNRNNNNFWLLLSHITALTNQLEKRYRSVLPFNIESNSLRKLGMKLRIAQDPVIKLWQHNDRLEQKMIELRLERSKKLEYYFRLNKDLRKALHNLIPVIIKNSSNPKLMLQAGFYKDVLKRFVLTPRIHQKLITAKDQFAINTTVQNILEINDLSGKYGNPGMVLGLQVSMSINPDALISLDKKFNSERERIFKNNPEELPKVWSIPLFEDLDTVKSIDSYLSKVWDYAVQSRSIDQEAKDRFSEILCEIFIAGSDLSQQVGQTASALLYNSAKHKTIEWLAKKGLVSDIRIKLGCGEPMQRQGGYYAEFSSKPAFTKDENNNKLFAGYLKESTIKSTEFAISPLHGVFAGGDLRTLQSAISEKVRNLTPAKRSQLYFHMRKTQDFYHSELIRVSEPFIDTRLAFESKSLKELGRLTLGKNDDVFNEFALLTSKNFQQIIYGSEDDTVGIHIISYFLSKAMPILRDRPVERPSRTMGNNQGQKILERIASTIPLCKHGSLLRAISHNKAQTFVLGINQLTTGLFRALNQFSQKEFVGSTGYQLLNDRILPRLPVYEILHTLRIFQDYELKNAAKFSDAFPAGLTSFSLLREDIDSIPIFVPMLQKELLRRHGINVSEFFKGDKFIAELLPTVRPDLAVLLQPDLFNTDVQIIVKDSKNKIPQKWVDEFSELLILPEKIKYWREKIWDLLENPVKEQVKSFVELAIALNTLSKDIDTRDFSSALSTAKKTKFESSLAYMFRGKVDDSMRQFLSAAVQYLTLLPSEMVEVPIDIVRALKEVERILRIEEQALTKKKQELLNFYLLQIAHHAGDNG
ncbi:MAG: pyridoxal phosphate-dependent aminotransferase [Ignavibacteriaceae bacterium]